MKIVDWVRGRGLRALAPAVLGVLAVVATAPAATIDLGLTADVQSLNVGQTVELSIIADISTPLLAFGFQVQYDDALFDLAGTETGPRFIPVQGSGEAYIGGLAYPRPVRGNDVLLGLATFTARQEGVGVFDIVVSDNDLTSGFAQVSVGAFANHVSASTRVTVVATTGGGGGGGGGGGTPPVPEPGALVLLAAGALIATLRRVRS